MNSKCFYVGLFYGFLLYDLMIRINLEKELNDTIEKFTVDKK